MIDVELVDRLFEQTSGQLQFGLMDRRVLFPLEDVPSAVRAETEEEITVDGLHEKQRLGWFTFLPQGETCDGKGVPLYVPSRVGLFLRLERDGWSNQELRLVAKDEEFLVDNVWTQDDFAYIDDDLETLIQYTSAQIDAFRSTSPAVAEEQLLKCRQDLETLSRLRDQPIGPQLAAKLAKAAFRARASNEAIRVWMLDFDRSKLKAGYGPATVFKGTSWNPSTGFQTAGVNWAMTVRSTIASADEGCGSSIRIPGFLLESERVTPLRTMRPSEYARLWNQNELDEYLRVRADLLSERRCLNCYAWLPETCGVRQRFCKEACRNASKQRRHRKEHPEAVEQAQKRYWDSITLD